MLNKLFIVFLFLFQNQTFSFSQEVNYNRLDTLKSICEVTSYTSKSGKTYHIGDKIKIGLPSVNDKFKYITEDIKGEGIKFLYLKATGFETEILKIYVVGNSRSGFTVSFKTKGLNNMSIYMIRCELAIFSGEIIH